MEFIAIGASGPGVEIGEFVMEKQATFSCPFGRQTAKSVRSPVRLKSALMIRNHSPNPARLMASIKS